MELHHNSYFVFLYVFVLPVIMVTAEALFTSGESLNARCMNTGYMLCADSMVKIIGNIK